MRSENPHPSDLLIIFTRYPEPGKSKTRLIPALGSQGAADLHQRMVEYTLFWAKRLMTSSGVCLETRFAGSDEDCIRNWLGPDIRCRPQGSGDIGQRMERAFDEAFQSGMERVIIVGTDIPRMTEDLVRKALAALTHSDVALGPARDGGYYLIGLRRPIGQLFEAIPWGTDQVLEKTLNVARDLQLRVFLLDPLEDVDRPEDLAVWERFVKEKFPLISIITPTLNEEENIAACLASTRSAPNVERIVVDGGSKDRTREIAIACGSKVVSGATGRARQMNAGAESAAGDLLLFLHADTRLPEGFADTVRSTLTFPGIVAGAFEFRLDISSSGLRFIERAANWRSRRLQLPYGDQGIFTRAALFREVGGYRDMPIMEDFEFIQRLKKKGRIFTAPLPAITSARRWEELGTWKATLMNYGIVIAYYLGISPARIHRYARRERE